MVTIQQVRPKLDLQSEKPSWIPCGFGLYFPSTLKGLAEVVIRTPFAQLNIELEFATYENIGQISRGQIAVTSIKIDQMMPESTVTSEQIRSVPVGRIANAVLQKSLAVEVEDGRFGPAALFTVPPRITKKWPNFIDDEFFHFLGTAYHFAEFCGYGPTAEIASKFNVSRATAGRMVDAARRECWIDITSAPNITSTDEWFQMHAIWLERSMDLQAPSESLPIDAPDFQDQKVLEDLFSGARRVHTIDGRSVDLYGLDSEAP